MAFSHLSPASREQLRACAQEGERWVEARDLYALGGGDPGEPFWRALLGREVGCAMEHAVLAGPGDLTDPGLRTARVLGTPVDVLVIDPAGGDSSSPAAVTQLSLVCGLLGVPLVSSRWVGDSLEVGYLISLLDEPGYTLSPGCTDPLPLAPYTLHLELEGGPRGGPGAASAPSHSHSLTLEYLLLVILLGGGRFTRCVCVCLSVCMHMCMYMG